MRQLSRLRNRVLRLFALACAVFGTFTAAAGTAPPAVAAPGLARFLDADGHLALPENFSGGLDPSGFELVSGAGEAPRFAAAQKRDADARWAEGFGLAGCGTINAIVVGPAGEIYLGGHFSSCGGVAANHVVRYDPGTDAWSPLGSGEGNGLGSFSIGGTVRALAVFDGDLYAGGDFNIANIGEDVRANNIARWDGSQWSAVGDGLYGAGTSGVVNTMEVWNGALYIGGSFRQANGTTAPKAINALRIARWDGSAWHALGGGIGDATTGWVRDLIAFDGALLVGGAFDLVGGTVSAKNLARWDGSAWSTVGSGAGNGVTSASGTYDLFGGVYAMAVWNGDLYLGGNFSRANHGEPVLANNIVRWDGADWHPVGGAAGNGASSYVEALVAADDGLYVGGRFNVVTGSITRSANRIARWDGSDWTSLGDPANNGVDDNVLALAAHDGVVYVGGYFDRTREAVPQIVRGIATWDSAFAVPGGNGGGLGIEGEVRAVAVYQGDLYVGGYITAAGGVPVNRIARWDGSQWSAVGSGGGNGVAQGSGAAVLAMLVHDGALYVGGGFNQANVGAPVAARNLARWDGSTWSAVGNGADGAVQALAASGTDLYVGGSFALVNADAPNPADRLAANRVARWDGGAWSALGSGGGNGVFGDENYIGYVYALAVFQNEVYVGGAFEEVNHGATDPGDVLLATGVARWDGNAWSTLATPTGQGVYGYTHAFAVAHGKLYLGGNFRAVNDGALIPAGGIAAWTGTGWEFLGTDEGNGANDHIYALAVHGDQLYVGGMFFEVDDTPFVGVDVGANYIARWDGSRWTRLGRGIGRGQFRFVYALAAPDADTLWVGGNFGAAGGTGAENVTRYGTRGQLDVSTSGAGNGRVTGPGGIDCPGTCAATLPWDTPVELVAQPVIDSELVAWSGDCSGDGDCVLPFEHDGAVDAQFAIRTFSLSYGADANGSIEGDAMQTVAYGADGSAVTAVPVTGYHFDGWSDGGDANPRTDGDVTADLDVTAAFAINHYDVSATAVGNGAATPDLQSIAHGASATITTTPADHHHVGDVSGDTCAPTDNGDGSWTAADIAASCAIVATFAIDTYTITAIAVGAGSITPEFQSVVHGGTAGFDVAAASNHHLVGVSGDTCTPVDDGGGQWRASALAGPCTVTATFAIDTYAVTAIAVGEGDITPELQPVEHGGTATFEVAPAANHHLVGVSGDTCTPVDGGGGQWSAAALVAPCTVTATFAIDTYAVTVSVEGEGELQSAPGTPFALTAVPHGSTVTFEAVPDAGHRAVSIAGCGASVEGETVFVTAPVVAACSIEAVFNRNPLALDASLALDEDAGAVAGQLAADDDDTTLTFELLDTGTRGTAVLLDAATGAYTYTPDADENGSDTLQFRVGDGGVESNVASISIDIAPINDPPGLALQGDLAHPAGSIGPHDIPGFAQFDPGPANEAAQQVDAYLVTALDDPDGVLVPDSLGVDAAGTLSYALSGVGGNVAVELRVRDDGGTDAGGIDLSAPATFTLSVAPSADLQVQKDDGRTIARSGDTLVYAITVANAGPNAADGVVLGDLPPIELVDVAWACVASGSTAPCPPPPHDAGTGPLSSTFDLPANTHLRFDLSAVVQGATGSSVVNTAQLTAPDGLTDPAPGNESSTDTTLIVPDGIFGDGFETSGGGLQLPAAKRAHERVLLQRARP